MYEQMISGVKIFVREDPPRYLLPEELVLPCGHVVTWPAGFRDEFNSWSRSFLGYGDNSIPDGQAWGFDGGLHVNPRTYASLKSKCVLP